MGANGRGTLATLATLAFMFATCSAAPAANDSARTYLSSQVVLALISDHPGGFSDIRVNAGPPWLDPTANWASPGANWIAWELNQVNPRWHIQAVGLDQFANDWCFAQNPQQLAAAVDKLILGTTPGADLRTLPALGQMLSMIEQSCIYQGGNPTVVDYWIQITANYMMTVVRDNTRTQIRSHKTAWTKPAPIAKSARASVKPQVIAGACEAVVDVGGNALTGKFTKLAGLKQLGLFSFAKIGCNKLVTKIWNRIF